MGQKKSGGGFGNAEPQEVCDPLPELVLKHSRIIHRSGMRARLFRVSLDTDPPPTSAEGRRRSATEAMYGRNEDVCTAMTACKPHFVDISRDRAVTFRIHTLQVRGGRMLFM
jgi:hypothetical protein